MAKKKDESLEEAVKKTVGKIEKPAREVTFDPDELTLVPLSRRPFFPGMAAPLIIEPGIYYEMLKVVAATEHKTMGLFLTKEEEVNIYKLKVDDFYKVGVSAKILRIIPMEQGGAQVILNMEKRITIKKGGKRGNFSRRRSLITKIRPQKGSRKR